MNIESLKELFLAGVKDKENNIEVLKRELKANDYKLCGLAVEMMIDEMRDYDPKMMTQEAAIYWKSLGLTHLPYNPANALKE